MSDEIVEKIYQVSISTGTISAITDKIIDKVKQWQSRPLDNLYPFVWLDAIHYKIKERRPLNIRIYLHTKPIIFTVSPVIALSLFQFSLV